MQPTRRAFLAGVTTCTLMTLLPACAWGGDAAFPFVPNSGYGNWVKQFRISAERKGITRPTLDAAFATAGYIPAVIEKDRNQFEFSLALEDYLAITASRERVKAGRVVLQKHRKLLAEIEVTYGVESHVIAAIWGVESFYGAKRGTVPTIAALSTLAYDGRRAPFFETQLIAALKILQQGDVKPQALLGGWAGAMGHTQFIPTTYSAYAVDFRGDGRRDIWSDDPTDSLASAANYLSKSGWTYRQPWGIEVTLPSRFNPALAENLRQRTMADWAKLGVQTALGGRPTDYGKGAIILPAADTGPAFLVFQNYTVITRYNAAQNYVIGLGSVEIHRELMRAATA